MLLLVSGLAEQLQAALWQDLPDAAGVGRCSVLWMFVVLTATEALVGLVVWKAAGHAGRDPATMGLDARAAADGAPRPPASVMSPMPAGGPSLGPENPVIAVNVGLAVWLGHRFRPKAPGAVWVVLAEAATIGALFGTPVAAALLISEALAERQTKGPLWDNVFAPLIAAAAGSMTTALVARPAFDLRRPRSGSPGGAICRRRS